MKSTILIGGTGRAGTSFLIILLTRLGIDTGFNPGEENYRSEVRAGGEIGIPDLPSWEKAPLVVKSPMALSRLRREILQDWIRIKHAILPIRRIEVAAESRVKTGLTDGEGIQTIEQQIDFIARNLGFALEVCALKGIPITLMVFPKLVEDEEYCYQKLSEVFKLDRKRFSELFQELANPEQIVFK